ncbi:hypothetical protein KL938_001336 [Ogataea parapolymorpha]|nr:hypothetical protein KL938_001336 [Ogataea parapolymorpha]
MSKAIKGTILCLHGYAQNGPTFSAKASGIRKALKKIGYHTVFVQGSLKIQKADLPFEVPPSENAEEEFDYRGWWQPNDDYDLQPALDAVKNYYKEHGPFIGIMGFSQGAGLAAVVCSKYAEIIGQPKASEELKFAILYAGFKLKPQQYQKYYENKIKLPTLHIFGELDTVVSPDRAEALVESCENATVLKHPGGHFVPSTKDLIRKEIAWVENVLSESKENPDSKKDEDKELEKLSEEIGKMGVA